MFRHARQLDLARRLNHADRKERILISLRDESRDSSRNPSFSVRHLASSPLLIFFLSSLSSLSPSNRPFGPTTKLLLLLPPPIRQFLFFPPLPRLPSNPEAKGSNCFFSFSPPFSLPQLPTTKHSRVFFLFLRG